MFCELVGVAGPVGVLEGLPIRSRRQSSSAEYSKILSKINIGGIGADEDIQTIRPGS
jgi:hypothetical protein